MAVKAKRKKKSAGSKDVRVTIDVNVNAPKNEPYQLRDPANEADLIMQRMKRPIPQAQKGLKTWRKK